MMMTKIPKKIGVVVSGGGLNATCSAAATFSVLDKLGIEPEAVCGSSGGVISAAMYASGMSGQDIKEVLCTLKLSDYFDPDYIGVFKAILNGFRGWHGILKGKAIEQWLKKHMSVQTFEGCRTRCYVVSVNVSKGVKEVIHSGNLIDAVRASSAIPFIYKAVRINKDYYIDGGAVSNVPAYALSEAEPNLKHILVSSTQDLDPFDDVDSEDIMHKNFTPYHIIKNWIQSLVREERAVHLDTQHIPNTLMKMKMSKVDYFHPENIRDGIESAEKFILQFLKEMWKIT